MIQNRQGQIELYPHQQECIDNIKDAFYVGFDKVLINAATGSGKSVIFTEIINNTNNTSTYKTFAIVVPSLSLVQQFKEDYLDSCLYGLSRFECVTICSHMYKSNHDKNRNTKGTVFLTTYQSLEKLFDKNIDLVIFDECHRCLNHNRSAKIFSEHNWYKKAIFASATPVNSKKYKMIPDNP